jgi:hypothetical protein
MSLKNSLLQFYHRHEMKFHISFFMLGFVFDYFAAEEIDHLFVILQQAFYLFIIAWILTAEHLVQSGRWQIQKLERLWQYRGLVLHFFLGTLLNLYSFFFLKSASLFNSVVFVILLILLIVGNEMPRVRQSGVNIRWALWALCLFSYFTILFPLILGFVGWFPFLLSATATILVLYLHLRWMMSRQPEFRTLAREFLQPGILVVAVFIGLYFLRLIPPVPLALKNMGIYHGLEKKEGHYILSHERSWWKFWQKGDQDFYARPGDVIYFFTQVFSPAHFSDEVSIRWLYQDPKRGWMSSDAVRMQINGGRKDGFRGFSLKKNYQPGSWRIQVETTDGREIGRMYFDVIPDLTSGERQWTQEIY